MFDPEEHRSVQQTGFSMKPGGLTAATLVVLFAAGLGCSGDGSGTIGPGDRGNGTGVVSFSRSVQPIFTDRCALSGCHAGAAPVQDMNLEEGRAFNDIVNVVSNVAALRRVRPGLPDSSYLVHKIQGTQASVGGDGEQMPLDNCCLSQAQIDVIRAWITRGAPNN